jgi:cell division initiation protein
MRITPLEIRQKTFEKNFRGYEKDEVHAFLMTLSQEWERLQDENKELRFKLESTEREIVKLREVEGSLYKTLKTAEDTGANVIDQARKAAELHLKESQLRADSMMHEAKSKAKDTIDESEMRAKEILADMEDRLKAMVDNYKKLESSREDLMSDLKRLGSDLLERVERSKNTNRDFDADKHLGAVKRETKKFIHPNYHSEQVPRNESKSDPASAPKAETPKHANEIAEEGEPEPAGIGSHPKKVQKSFFDEIG